jgi:hypothetical protein
LVFAVEGERVRFGRAFSLEKSWRVILSYSVVLQGVFEKCVYLACVFVVTFVVKCVAEVDQNPSFVGC